MKTNTNDTIIAIATPPGQGAIGIIRLSGPQAIDIVDRYFYGRNLQKVAPNTVHYGKIKDDRDRIIDECVATVYRAPRSYTKEDVVELNCHGSPYILSQVLQLLIQGGARQADPGEYTMRAFLNGQLDLSQAEAVADLIAAQSDRSHQTAIRQLRGGISIQIEELRQELIDFAALIELELDFGEEDVQFADREKLEQLIIHIQGVIRGMIDTFAYGNALKSGVPVAIIGRPNVGKSTLLNALLDDDRAIVSEIAGTTRDAIEDSMVIDGIQFRFVDTAGIRQTEDQIESIGITKTLEQIKKAQIILYIDDINSDHREIVSRYKDLRINPKQKAIILLNKADTMHNVCSAYDVEEAVSTLLGRKTTIAFSAKEKTRLEELKDYLVRSIQQGDVNDRTLITNTRHYEALTRAAEALDDVLTALRSGISGDLMALDIRQALHHLGLITGEIHTDDLLDSIFERFCIGK